MTTPTKVGFIGTGVMGTSLVKHLLKANLDVTIYNRRMNSKNVHELVKLGAKPAKSPRDLAAQSRVVLSMVGFPSDVRETVLDGENSVLSGISRDSLLIEMTTSTPKLAKEIHARHAKSLDAPVSGGDVGAREGKLTMMVGGTRAVFEEAVPILKLFGTPHFLGGPGNGQQCKMANQITIAGAMIGLCEGMLYAEKAGLKMEDYINAIGKGGASSRSLDLYSPRILRGDWEPGFFVKHFVKDLGIALDEAREMKLALPGLAIVSQLYVALAAQNEGDLGTQALIRVLRRMNGMSAL